MPGVNVRVSAAILVFTGCLPSEHDDGAEPPAEPLSVTWQPCAVHTGGDDDDALCAQVPVPARWAEPATRPVSLFVKKIPAAVPSQRALWLLQGGPGGASDAMEVLVDALAPLDPTLDFYLLDHRGTGRSSRLGCAQQEDPASAGGSGITPDEAPACAAALKDTWGDDLAAFNITEAANDLGQLIAALNADDDAFVFGVSYGTLWAQRYLQLFPDQASGVVIDSIVPPTESFTRYDRNRNSVGKLWMDVCGQDELCASKLGTDPWAEMGALFEAVDDGHCSALGAPQAIRDALRQLAGNIVDFREARPLIPPLVYRARRCSDADVTAIVHFYNFIVAAAGGSVLAHADGHRDGEDLPPTLNSQPLFLHIATSELWDPDGDAEEVQAFAAFEALVSTDLGAGVARVVDVWPRYTPDALDGAFADTAVPMLMLNGTLDAATPLAGTRTVRDHFTRTAQTFVVIDGAPHAAVLNSPLKGDPDMHCGLLILESFLRDPLAEPDTSCLQELAPVSFDAPAGIALAAFGTADLWENP